MSDRNKVIKTINHPLEDYFDIESGSTEMEIHKTEVELVEAEDYDEKDSEIESQYEEIYNRAMDGYEDLAEEVVKVDGKYKARLGEVSVQHLNVALNAASHKAKMKEHKDKLTSSKTKGPSSVTNNNTLIVDDRNALVNSLKGLVKPGEET